MAISIVIGIIIIVIIVIVIIVNIVVQTASPLQELVVWFSSVEC